MPIIKNSYQHKSKTLHRYWRHFNQGQKFLLLYLFIMVLIGLPITVWSIQQTVSNRSKATQQVSITATVPTTAYNTPIINAENNQPPIIHGPQQLDLQLGSTYDIDYTITDPDWRRGDTPPVVSFNPQFEFPEGLEHDCFTFGNFTSCRIFGTPLSWRPPGQLIMIGATDPHGFQSSLQVIVNFSSPDASNP